MLAPRLDFDGRVWAGTRGRALGALYQTWKQALEPAAVIARCGKAGPVSLANKCGAEIVNRPIF
jgi:hypothetical protein